MKEKVLCSACFVQNCLFNGSSNISELKLRPSLKSFLEQSDVTYFCPEVEGGMTTPRIPSRISGKSETSDGNDVLSGNAKVVTDNETDVTKEFLAGAKKAVQICQENDIKIAILKRTSPSCGSTQTQGGISQRQKIQGDGVTAAALKLAGIKVISEKEFAEK